MYLIFSGDGVKKANVIYEDEKTDADNRLINLIDISGKEPKQYYDGKWHDLESADG